MDVSLTLMEDSIVQSAGLSGTKFSTKLGIVLNIDFRTPVRVTVCSDSLVSHVASENIDCDASPDAEPTMARSKGDSAGRIADEIITE